MKEFENLSKYLVQAALSAELEYARWTKKSILEMGCEPLLSTSVARAASAFYGFGGIVKVFLEEPLSKLYRSVGSKSTKSGGRVDCVAYKGEIPYVLIECKRRLV